VLIELAALVVPQPTVEPLVVHVFETAAVHFSALGEPAPAALVHPVVSAESNPGYWALSTPKSSVIISLLDTFPWH
jgi:hypothetical protein